MKKEIMWTPDAKSYTALKYSLDGGIVSVQLLDGSIRKVVLQECSTELQQQFKN